MLPILFWPILHSGGGAFKEEKMSFSAHRRPRPHGAASQRRMVGLNKNRLSLRGGSLQGNSSGHNHSRLPATELSAAGLPANKKTLPSHTSELAGELGLDLARAENKATPFQVVPMQHLSTQDVQQLADLIFERIQTRLPSRIHNLEVRITTNSVELTGECRTYYTKQMAQHVAMGVLDYQQLVNNISVSTAC
jgi:hypothetical protein